MTETAAPPVALPIPIQLMQMISGGWITQIVGAAAELRVADHVAAGRTTAKAIAEAAGASPEGMRRLLRAMGAVGLLAETPGAEPTYGLTPLSELLRGDVPGSMRDMARMMALPAHWNSWGLLADAIRTNEGVFAKAMKATDVFTYLHGDPREAEAFNGAMTNLSAMAGQAVAGAYDWSRFGTLVDVGGGHGALLAAILGTAPATRGVLFDLPAVVDSRPADGPAAALGDRLQAVGGDFFAAVPAGDAYVMKHILHDWSDELCLKILKAIRAAIGPDGKLLVVEMVVPDAPGPDMSKLMDLNMLVMTPGGKERTAAEWTALFAEGGFRLGRIIPTPSNYAILEADPA